MVNKQAEFSLEARRLHRHKEKPVKANLSSKQKKGLDRMDVGYAVTAKSWCLEYSKQSSGRCQ